MSSTATTRWATGSRPAKQAARVLSTLETSLRLVVPHPRINLAARTPHKKRVELELVPNPDLDAARRALIEEQYGMKEGSKIVRVRQCMLTFFLKRYHLEEPTTLKAPHQAPLRLRNRRMATELLPIGMRVRLGETDALALLSQLG